MNDFGNGSTVVVPEVPTPREVRVRLSVDWEGLAVAFENQLADSHSFLDLESGRVQTVVTRGGDAPIPPGPPETTILIPPRPSREGYRTMQRFLDRVSDPALRERLAGALVGKGAFRRFKDLLLDYPDVRSQWFTFKDAEIFAYISEWLQREGVAAENSPPTSTSRERIPAGRKQSNELRPVVAVSSGSGDLDWMAAIADYDRPERTFRPERAALLVIDMQRVFVEPDGASFLPRAPAVAARLAELIAVCREEEVPVIFTRHVHRSPHEDGGQLARWWRSLILEGTRDAELCDALRPRPGERVIEKCRYDAFVGTPLESILRALEIEDLLIGGVLTNLCCETTARSAFVRDFGVFFLGDGTATADDQMHLASLRNISYGFGRVMGVSEALTRLGRDELQSYSSVG